MVERGRGNTVSAPAKIIIIHIEFENFIFGEGFFHAPRNRDFANFAVDRIIIANQKVFRDLLRNCGGSTNPLALEVFWHSSDGRTQKSFWIPSIMGIKSLIFRADKSALKICRNGFDWNKDTRFGSEFTDQFAVTRMYPAHNGRTIFRQAFYAWEITRCSNDINKNDNGSDKSADEANNE